MRFIKQYGLALFLLILLVHCLFIYLEMNELRVLTKLLLLPFLIVYLFAVSANGVKPLVVTALVFSFIGDLLLAFQGQLYFMLGMLAFIFTHVCNGASFFKLQKAGTKRQGITFFSIAVLLLLVLLVLLLIYRSLGKLMAPIIVYMVVISLMTILASRTLSVPRIKKIALTCFIPGAFLFVLSDGILAINKFFLHRPLVDIPVMVTYGLAQLLLVRGFIWVANRATAEI